MTPAERIYRILLWLYPAQHRQAYGRSMLQHARDLNRATTQRGRWPVAVLCLRLIVDGIVSAGTEHMEAIMSANGAFKPVPWLSVLLAAAPGLLFALSRSSAVLPTPALMILGGVYVVFLVLAWPVVWWRRRRFPVWALLPAGALMWVLTYFAVGELSWQIKWLGIKWLGIPGSNWTASALVNIALAGALFMAVLRTKRIPAAVWVLVGVMVLGNALAQVSYGPVRYGGDRQLYGLLRFFAASLSGPAEGLLLVALGLLAARQHGVRALLVVVGGYAYWFVDSDYLFGFPSPDWTWKPLYFVIATILVLVAVPVALLRAKTRLGLALGMFVPTVTFHLARFAIPVIVWGQSFEIRLGGDVLLSINVLLSFVLAWILYGYAGNVSSETKLSDLELTPSLD